MNSSKNYHLKQAVKPLGDPDRPIKNAFQLAILFYRRNKKIGGKSQEARDFFKHVNLSKQLNKMFEETPKYGEKIEKNFKQLLLHIDKTKE